MFSRFISPTFKLQYRANPLYAQPVRLSVGSSRSMRTSGFRYVIANRRPRFVKNGRLAGVGEFHTVERNFDVAGAVQKVDALIWIVRVDENLLFFLDPASIRSHSKRTWPSISKIGDCG